MVYSLFCASNKIRGDIVVCYSDIIFDHKVYNSIKIKLKVLLCQLKDNSGSLEKKNETKRN